MKILKWRLMQAFILVFVLYLQIVGFAGGVATEGKTLAVDKLVSIGGESSFRILVTNDDIQSHKYALSCTLPKESYKADFFLQGKIIKELEIIGNDKIILDLHVSVPTTENGNTNILNVESRREDGKINTIPISITTNRDYSLEIKNQVDGLKVINGQTVSVEVAVSNTGSKPMDNVSMKFDLPYKWMAQSISPEKLSLRAGENGLFKVQILVPPTQASGNNSIKVWAISDKISSAQVVIPIIVTSNPNYLYWVFGLIVLTGIVTILYFRKHGRR